MGNTSSYDVRRPSIQFNRAPDVTDSLSGNQKIDATIRGFAEFLKNHSSAGTQSKGITESAITEYICNHNASLGKCLFKQFCAVSQANTDSAASSESVTQLTIEQYIAATNHFISIISDSEQILFFAKGFGEGNTIDRAQAMDAIRSSYEMTYKHHPEMCTKAATAVVDAIMHGKEFVSVGYFSKWCMQNCQRLVYWMHRHLGHTLAAPKSSHMPFDMFPLPEKASGTPEFSNIQEFSENPAITEESPDSNPNSLSENFAQMLRKASPKLAHRMQKMADNSNQLENGNSPKLGLKKSKSSENSLQTSPTLFHRLSPKLAKKQSSSTPSPPKSPGAVKPSGTPRQRKANVLLRASSEQDDGHPIADNFGDSGFCTRSKSANNLAVLNEVMNQERKATSYEVKDIPLLHHNDEHESILSPSMMWLLTCTLPIIFSKTQRRESIKQGPPQRRVSLPTVSVLQNFAQRRQSVHWEPLYNSDRDGLGMNRFEHHALNYRGPTLTFVSAQEDGMAFCIASDCEWKNSQHFWGGEDSRLVQLYPQYRVLESGEKILYFNTTWRGFPTGIQVGGDYQSRALTVNKELTEMQHYNIPYKISSIEVWGCGAKEVREHQQEYKKRLVQDVERRRKVKITSSEWLEHPDRLLLQMASAKTSYVFAERERPRPDS